MDARLSSDGTRLVWVEDRLIQYGLEINDCKAERMPVKVAEFESPINSLDFLNYYH